MKYIQGIVKALIFYSNENSYNIIKVKITDSNEDLNIFMYDDYITVTGYFPQPLRGEEIKFFGKFTDNPKYGTQYVVNNFEKLSDTSIAGLIEYLSSDLFKGIGLKTATNIVNSLGKDTIKLVIDDKEVLNNIPKMSPKLKEVVYQGLIKNKASENTLIKLYGYGITPRTAMKIFKTYQNETIAIIEKNPYQLIYDIEGIGFERADLIAKKLGFKDNDPLRVKAMILYLYNLMGVNYGHTFLYTDQLKDYLTKQLNKNEDLVTEDEILDYLEDLINDKVFVRENDMIKLTSISYAEQNIINKVKELTSDFISDLDTKRIDNYIKLFEEINEIEYTELQKKSIYSALKSNLFILTGGPGTGKTTVIKGIVFVYCKYNQIPIEYNNSLFQVKLIAPTGRAAKRMNETTKLHAETIHRFLGYNFQGKFLFNKDNLVDADVIIVDEASMIDVFLASQLFQSIPKTTKVIIVGDEDQLPSVGPGQILKDLIDTDMIDSVRLNTIHRQASDSNIIKLAYDVNNSQLPLDIFKAHDDRYFVTEDVNNFESRIVNIISYLQVNNYDLHEDIQVLIPMYRGKTGIDNINTLLQNEFNTNTSKILKHGDREFRIGDKVIQLSNQIEDNVMNGDQGIVIGITEEKVLIVDFLGNEVSYKMGDLINLKHAYAMSIHKSQGSEYKVVILPIYRGYSIMLKRKLLYTAITRAKEKLILIGDLNAFKYGVERTESSRQSILKDLIIDKILSSDNIEVKNKTEKREKINDSSIPFEYLGEEINEKVSPYDFMEK
jgi:exodeoxyribonuclease V alpha subunit